MKRTFIHLSRAWYGPSGLRADSYVDEVQFGPDGDDAPSSDVFVRWYELGIARAAPKLEAHDDAWAALSMCADVIAWMATVDNRSVSPTEFCQALERLGFTDVTPLVQKR